MSAQRDTERMNERVRRAHEAGYRLYWETRARSDWQHGYPRSADDLARWEWGTDSDIDLPLPKRSS